MIQPFSQLFVLQVVLLVLAQTVILVRRLIASLRAVTSAVKIRLWLLTNRLFNTRLVKLGVANVTAIAATAKVVMSSIKVKPE